MSTAATLDEAPPIDRAPDAAGVSPAGAAAGNRITDTLASALGVMLLMTIVQRGLGFGRGLWFCRLMNDVDVGRWSLAYDFVVMMTPIAMLGVPGSLSRFVEYFSARGRLRRFVTNTAAATVGLGLVWSAAILVGRQFFGWFIFLDCGAAGWVTSVAAAAASVVMFNYAYELCVSLRRARAASTMQFIQSVSFSVVGVGWLIAGHHPAHLAAVFAVCTLAGLVPAVSVWRNRHAIVAPAAGTAPGVAPEHDAAPPSIWRVIAPYAASLWVMNLLANAFNFSDRYMILHHLPGGDDVTRAAVGQYHSGRIIPLLLMSLATMISGVILPYLSADWESDRRDRAITTLRRVIVAVAAGFTAGGAFVLAIAPWLFGTLLEGRYAEGLQMMPLAMVFCIWGALFVVAQDYLWVVRRGLAVGGCIAVALVINVALNFAWLPTMGLGGAVLATTVANGVMLAALLLMLRRRGFDVDLSIITAAMLPATILGGPVPALGCTILFAAVNPDILDSLRQAVSRFQRRP